MRVERIGGATLYCADYRDVDLPTGIDAVLTDPPYGKTNCAWDKEAADLPAFWEKINPVTKENAAVVVFGTTHFYVDVVNSNRKNFRYDLVWEKSCPLGFLDANKKPLRAHELLAVFYRMLPEYHPQKTKGKPYTTKRHGFSELYSHTTPRIPTLCPDGLRYPRSVLFFNSGNHQSSHPTAKPVPLMEWLVRTYTSAGQTVCDPFMGSGSTGVAALLNNRRFIGVEREEKYFDIACQRLEDALREAQKPQQLVLI